jgi:hypothetical protein
VPIIKDKQAAVLVGEGRPEGRDERGETGARRQDERVFLGVGGTGWEFVDRERGGGAPVAQNEDE